MTFFARRELQRKGSSLPIALIALIIIVSSWASVEGAIENLVWGANGKDTTNGIVVDESGHMIVVGCTSKVPLTFPDSKYNGGISDAYVVKYSVSGSVLWYRTIGTSLEDCANDVGIDSVGNIYVTGYTSGSLATRGGHISEDLDIFLTKFTKDGSHLWSKQLGTQYSDIATSIKVTESIVISGITHGQFKNPAEGNCDDVSQASVDPLTEISFCDDAIIMKLDLGGNALWSYQLSTPESDRAYGVDVAANGNVVVIGQTHGEVPHGGGQLDTAVLQSLNRYPGDMFALQLNGETGAPIWTRQIGTDKADGCFMGQGFERGSCDIVIDNNRVYLTGTTSGYISSPELTLQSKYNAACGTSSAYSCVETFVMALMLDTGSTIFATQLVSKSRNNGNSIALLPDGVAILGTTDAGLVDDPSRSEWFQDAFIVKFSASGERLEMAQLGTSGNDYGSAMAFDGKHLYVAGYSNVAAFGKPANFQAFVELREAANLKHIDICQDEIYLTESYLEVNENQDDGVIIKVHRSSGTAHCGTATVTYETVDPSKDQYYGENQAVPNRDYVASSGELTWGEGETTAAFRIRVLNNDVPSYNGTLLDIQLLPNNAATLVVQPSVIRIHILDDGDGPPDMTDGSEWRHITLMITIFSVGIVLLILGFGKHCGLGRRNAQAFQHQFSHMNKSAKELEGEILASHLHSISSYSGDNTNSSYGESVEIQNSKKVVPQSQFLDSSDEDYSDDDDGSFVDDEEDLCGMLQDYDKLQREINLLDRY